MFLINQSDNKATPICKKTFGELKLSERYDLQEWIANTPAILGEKLLIIQKEFSGFSDTNERLDLLALDGLGNLVIIENKLDDSGRDVVWQAIKYASYCAKLSTTEIIDVYQKFLTANAVDDTAELKIREFFDGLTLDEIQLNTGEQRIVLVAANFRKEVTSTALWLLEHNVQIKCIQVTPYLFNGSLLLDAEQIIPVREAEEYIIGLSNKKQDSQKRTASSSQKINEEIFFSQLTQQGELVFGQLFKFAKENSGLFFRWGTKGFSLNLRLNNNGSFVGLCFGYPPNSVFRQSIYTGIDEINKKIENNIEVVDIYKNGVAEMPMFANAGNNYKWIVSGEATIEQANQFTALLSEIINSISEA